MKKAFLAFISLTLLCTACQDENEFSRSADATIFSSDSSNSINNTASTGENTDVSSGTSSNEIVENSFILTSEEQTSTFSIDADGASLANTRRHIQELNTLPHPFAVRTEEFINYFNYDYPQPEPGHPIGLEGEVSTCPWNPDHKLVRIGMKGKDLDRSFYPPSNLVFLIDVSGSMNSDDKLGLLKQGFSRFADQLRPEDRISIVTYASNPRVVLPSTPGSDRLTIKSGIEALSAGGSTNGEGGILTAYDIAEANFIDGGNNRIIIGTDGDFNVGISSQDELTSLIEEKREGGIFLSVLGVGLFFNEGTMEQLANHGNGTFEYLDRLEEIEKVFVNEYNKFFAVAKDVKVQVEFNPENVEAYRLIGYENRLLENEDFEDDTKDAGEVGAGQSITALYEIVPTDNLNLRNSAFTINFRYKFPDLDVSIPLDLDIFDEGNTFNEATANHRFAAAVASFGLLVRDSEYKGETSYEDIRRWADSARTFDPYGYKEEFIQLIDAASGL